MKSARRRARELATQGLYQWLISNAPTDEIGAQLRYTQGFDKADQAYFEAVLSGVIRNAAALSADLAPYLDRPVEQLSQVECAVLLIATFEFKNYLDIPYRVIINEAVELAKTFGGEDGYKYVNGVLDKLATQTRATELRLR